MEKYQTFGRLFGAAILDCVVILLPVNWGVSFVIVFFNNAYVLSFWFSIVDVIVCLANEKRRALQDFIAGTIVVGTDV